MAAFKPFLLAVAATLITCVITGLALAALIRALGARANAYYSGDKGDGSGDQRVQPGTDDESGSPFERPGEHPSIIPFLLALLAFAIVLIHLLTL